MYSPVPQQYRKPKLQIADICVLGLFIFLLYGTVVTAQRWHGGLQTDTEINLSYGSLAVYSILSLFRALIAYCLSLLFTLVFGYLAAKYKTAEQIILPLLDIGQSIPVLGFLPGLVLGLIAIFPTNNLGLELACILLIFTGQVWNMTFSFYSSLKSIPKHFLELGENVQLSFFQRFGLIELPYSSSGLAWNSLMSMAGGWFFLTVCEAFTLGDQHFRLPGLGAYMAVAIEQDNLHAMIAGVVAMVIVIVTVDFFLWRPIIAWTRRFQLDEQQDTPQELPYFQKLIQDSRIIRKIEGVFKELFWLFRREKSEAEIHAATAYRPRKKNKNLHKWLEKLNEYSAFKFLAARISWIILVGAAVWVVVKTYAFLQPLTHADLFLISKSTLYTFLRVMFALAISTLWAVPFGLWVGLSQKRTQFFQPFIQIAASFPAPMVYPIVLSILTFLHIGIGFGSSVLMLLGVQWYVLFNVLAGTTMISRELRDTFKLIGLTRTETWKKLYLPSIFPALVTGWVTAAGGAWNASIVSEYVSYKNNTLIATGLGSLISDATAHGNYPVLAGSLLAMVLVVVGFNRTVWHKLYQLVERRFKFER